jgi:hypothetical protein
VGHDGPPLVVRRNGCCGVSRGTVCVWVTPLPVPVIVTVDVPVGVFLFVVTVMVDVVVAGFGLNDAEGGLGGRSRSATRRR